MLTLTATLQRSLASLGIMGIECNLVSQDKDREVFLPGGTESIVRVAQQNNNLLFYSGVTFDEDSFLFEYSNPKTGKRESIDVSEVYDFTEFEYHKGEICFHVLYMPLNGYLIKTFSEAAPWYDKFNDLKEIAEGEIASRLLR